MFGDLFKAKPKKQKATKEEMPELFHCFCNDLAKTFLSEHSTKKLNFPLNHLSESDYDSATFAVIAFFDSVIAYALYTKQWGDVVTGYKTLRKKHLATIMPETQIVSYFERTDRICLSMKRDIEDKKSVPETATGIAAIATEHYQSKELIELRPAMATFIAAILPSVIVETYKFIDAWEVPS
ncbi:MAG: hypothetical protein AB7V08_09555 [Elusimicrobiales bacterium]